MSYDLVGVHTERDADNLRHGLVQEVGASVVKGDVLELGEARARIKGFPIGIDVKAFQAAAQKSATLPLVRQTIAGLGSRQLIIGVDRLDYSKGIPERMESFERFLVSNPDQRGRVTYLQIAPTSRSEVPEYATLSRAVNDTLGRINGSLGEPGWVPSTTLPAAIRDRSGGTLPAGESRSRDPDPRRHESRGQGICRRHRIRPIPEYWCLSKFAGAAQQLTDALVVNPNDKFEVAEAINDGASHAVGRARPTLVRHDENPERAGRLLVGVKYLNLESAASARPESPYFRGITPNIRRSIPVYSLGCSLCAAFPAARSILRHGLDKTDAIAARACRCIHRRGRYPVCAVSFGCRLRPGRGIQDLRPGRPLPARPTRLSKRADDSEPARPISFVLGGKLSAWRGRIRCWSAYHPRSRTTKPASGSFPLPFTNWSITAIACWSQAGAGLGAGLPDEDYIAAGAEIVEGAERIFAEAEMIVKVKEPLGARAQAPAAWADLVHLPASCARSGADSAISCNRARSASRMRPSRRHPVRFRC